MSFNAGGTNVGGTQQIEQGTLKVLIDTTASITANGDYDVVHTVPTGKNWVFKSTNNYKSSGTYTVSVVGLHIMPTGTGGNFLTNATGTSNLTYVTTTPITLPAGAVIRVRFTITGWSGAGVCTSKILIQESNA